MTADPRIAIPTPTSFDFDYNHHCWPQYARAVEDCGGQGIEIPLSATQTEVADLVRSCQGILLPGSPADVHPQKYGQERLQPTAQADLARESVDELLLQDAHNLHKPILAICYGLQMLNTWRGGTLVQDLLPMPINHSAGPNVLLAHAVTLSPGSILRSLMPQDQDSWNELTQTFVNSSHHQAIDIPGDNLLVAARSLEDGVIEALEAGHSSDGVGHHFVVGVQWHPERSYQADLGARRLFERFLTEAKTWEPRLVRTSVVSPL